MLEKEREHMSWDEEVSFINYWFNKYEEEQFSKVFTSPYEENKCHLGKSFVVLNRMWVKTEDDNGVDTSDLECLPSWKIQFEDGQTMVAYPEEIVPSEIITKERI